MEEKILLSKTCSICASELHFATIIVPFVNKEIEKNAIIKTILEKDEKDNIEKVIKNVGLNSEKKEQIRNIDWEGCSIEKIRNIFNLLERDIQKEKEIDIIIQGNNIFIEKINKAIDLWVRNNIENLEKSKAKVKIINCFKFSENKEIEEILENHEYILKTAGIEEIFKEEELSKAN